MNLLSLDRVTKSNGEKKLFQEITFGIAEGEKVALVGQNGCGKTTLFRLLTGMEIPDSGTVSKNKALKMRFLEQNPSFDPAMTISDCIFEPDNPRDVLVRRYEEITKRMETAGPESLQTELQSILEDMEKLKIWDYESEIHSMLKQLGIVDLTRTLGELSGGMLKKVFLARSLIGDSNLVLLDEPTNHLDLDTIIWLESYLKKTLKTVFLITHDRYILDQVCNVIYEIDRLSLFRYDGNYEYYMRKKTAVEETMRREDARIAGILRVELEWLSRGPKARGTKSKSRIDRIEAMMARETFQEAAAVEMSVTGRKLGSKVLEVHGVGKSYSGREVIREFSHIFQKGERIGFVGPNGSGKTTLLRLLTGRTAPDKGFVDAGVHTHFGYFDQTGENLKPEMLLIDYIKSAAEMITLPGGKVISASQMLERFLFPPIQHYTPIGHLSGGEKRRLVLLSVLMTNPNFLVLDEPTNDLDIATLSVLEDFLSEFEGCLVVISHDRYFLDRTVDSLFTFDGNGGVRHFPGSSSDYLAYLEEMRARDKLTEKERENSAAAPTVKTVQPVKKLSYKEKQELEGLPSTIEQLENRKAELENLFGQGEYDPARIQSWTAELEQLQTRLPALYARWDELLARE